MAMYVAVHSPMPRMRLQLRGHLAAVGAGLEVDVPAGQGAGEPAQRRRALAGEAEAVEVGVSEGGR